MMVLPKGTKFTCVAGHHTATLARDLHRGIFSSAHLSDPPPFQKRSAPSARLGLCMCGRSWVRGVGTISVNGETGAAVVTALHCEGRGWVEA